MMDSNKTKQRSSLISDHHMVDVKEVFNLLTDMGISNSDIPSEIVKIGKEEKP